ncbi:MAG TPA: ferritin-like domain-containing protein [Pseudogracilibacillus sp.]|nr:ferritin-like domain-containing protein [Pseudogracilibacillus sp.]
MGRSKMQRYLNGLLANYFVLYIKLYRYKYYVKGKQFYAYRMFFEELQEAVMTEIDTLTSYIVSINGRPFCTMEKFLKETSLEEATADDELAEMMHQLIHDFTKMKREVFDQGMKEADAINDIMTKQVLVERVIFMQAQITTCLTFDK